jgi:hypothetical protein
MPSGCWINVANSNYEHFSNVLYKDTLIRGLGSNNIIISPLTNDNIGVVRISQNSIDLNKNVNVKGHIVPIDNIVYDLGTQNQRFRDLYLSGNTIKLGDGSISFNEKGTIEFTSSNGNVVAPEIPDGSISISKLTNVTGSGVVVLNNNPILSGNVFVESITGTGISSDVNSSSNNVIASSLAVKTAYDVASLALPRTGGTITGPIQLNNVITGTGISSNVNSSSNNVIASSLAVKTAYDVATLALPRTGGTITGPIELNNVITGTGISSDVNSSSNNVIASSLAVKTAYDVATLALPRTGGTITGPITFSTNGTNRLIINDAGNIGIGIANPSKKLEIDGTIKLGSWNLGNDNKLSYNAPNSGTTADIWYEDYGNNINSGFRFKSASRTVPDIWFRHDGSIMAVAVNTVSDARLKSNKIIIDDATCTLNKLKPQFYNKWSSMDYSTNSNASFVKESGLIAQDIFYDAPELRHLVTPIMSGYPEIHPDYLLWGSNLASVNYTGLIPYLIKAVQEKDRHIKSLEARIEAAGW